MKFTKIMIQNFFNLENVNIDLNNGNTLIVGPNGSGKTNIIKCVQFLVDKILEKYGGNQQHRSADQHEELQEIWKPNKECCIEVHACFNQAEFKLFSKLRVLFLMAEVCNFVFVLIGFLWKLYKGVVERRETRDRLEDKLGDRDELSASDHRDLQMLNEYDAESELIESLPEKLRTKILNHLLHDNEHPNSRFVVLPDEVNLQSLVDDAGASKLVTDFTNDVFPKLLDITKALLLKDESHFEDQCHHVELKAYTQNSGKLEFSVDVLDSAWLPAKCVGEKEYSVISEALVGIFGTELAEHAKFCINNLDYESGNLESLESSFKELLETRCNDSSSFVSAVLSGENGFDDEDDWNCRQALELICGDKDGWLVNNDTFRGMLRETAWGAELSSCLKRLKQKEWGSPCKTGKKAFLQFAAARCLTESTASFILPQNREGAMEQGDLVLTMKSLGQLLVTSKLSEDGWAQEQFRKVKVGMESFCAIEIGVRQKKREVVQTSKEELSKEFKALGKALAALSEIDHPLSKIVVQEVVQKAPSWSGEPHVMLRRTSPYKYESSLSGLSRGEIEILMVLCAIHLSGADTVFLDEPGHCLHPPQQAQLSRYIETLQHPDPVCVLITHSVEFINRQSLRSLYHMSFTEDGFTSFRLKVELAREEHQQDVSMEASPSTLTAPNVTLSRDIISELMRPDMRKMFFASGVYFVEGESDKLVLSAMRHHLLKKACDKQNSKGLPSNLETMPQALEMDQWDVLALGGCGNAMKAYKASAELKIPCALVLDADTITVKTGIRVEPFSPDTWKKSMLYRTLTNQRNSLEVAETVLNEIESMFNKGLAPEQTQYESRKILQGHGIWVWKGDLESEVCDSPAKREQLKKMDDLMEALGERFATSCSLKEIRVRGAISVDDALADYDRQVLVPLESLMDELHCELDSARDRTSQDPSQRMTTKLQTLIDKFKKFKQPLKQHDKFCEKGSKRPAAKIDSDATPSKKFASETLSSQAQSQAQSQASPPDEELPSAVNLDNISWGRIKRKLHGGGWTKLPWETLLKVMEVCLHAEGSCFQEFYEFMKKCQCKAIN